MGAIRADFKTHCDDRRDVLMLLPVVRKLLPEMFQEVDLIRVHTPSLATPYGDILYMRIPALQPGLSRTVLRRNTSVQRAHSLRLTPKKSQAAWDRRHEARRRHFRTKRDQDDERAIGAIMDIQSGALRKALHAPGEFQKRAILRVDVELARPDIVVIVRGEAQVALHRRTGKEERLPRTEQA